MSRFAQQWMMAILLVGLSGCTKDAKDYPNLKIKDLKVGNGEELGSRDTMYVHYVGRFPNGKEFDRSPAGKPRRYSMNARTLIDGWRIGLVGMKVGGKRRLTIPPELAFGKAGKLGKFPPNATLVFEVELVKIQ